EQAIQMVGRDLYETLIKGYTEKQWGRSCKDLPSRIIKRIPLRFTYDNNYYHDTYQGLPRTGYTSWISNMLGETDIELGLDYFDIPGGYKSISEQVIFTGRIDEYYECCYGELEYRTLEFREETLNVVNFQGNAIINYTQREIPYTRIIEHKHFKKQPSSMSIITKEYPAEWKNGQEPYYPIRDPGNIALYNKYLEHANSDANVRFGGRLGLYQYLDMDQTIYEAMRLANCLAKLQ
ncbi:MAG: UDP-galactopyranose mutase, partial [Methanomicrobiales archaeon HGW-Methanomicrobiales-5]